MHKVEPELYKKFSLFLFTLNANAPWHVNSFNFFGYNLQFKAKTILKYKEYKPC